MRWPSQLSIGEVGLRLEVSAPRPEHIPIRDYLREPSVTPKERQRLVHLRAAVELGKFSESDASALLMILRENIGDGPLKELSHHIAHSERNRGQFFRRIFENKKVLEELGRASGVLRSGDVFPVSDFAHDLNRALGNCGLAPLELQAIERLLVSIMSLLQGCSYKKRKKFAELSIGASTTDISLWATVDFENKGKTVKAKFAVLTVPNRWLPICNPRAHVVPSGLVEVTAAGGDLEISGFEPFRVQIEREPAITKPDLDAAIGADHRLVWMDAEAIKATTSGGLSADIRWHGDRLTLDGRPEYFERDGEMTAIIRSLAQRLGACVHDDSNAHWFVPGLEIAEDGFHSHWIGNAGPRCNRRL